MQINGLISLKEQLFKVRACFSFWSASFRVNLKGTILIYNILKVLKDESYSVSNFIWRGGNRCG